MIKHLSDEELIELYYGGAWQTASAHLQACRVCAAQYAELKQSLDTINTIEVPQKNAQYGEQVWGTLLPRLIPYEKEVSGWREWAQWRAITLSLGCAMLVATAFVGGRYWERHTGRTNTVARSASPHPGQPTVVVILADH